MHRHERAIRRQIVALSCLAGLGWVIVVIGLLVDPGYAQIAGGVAGPLFVVGQIIVGLLVWRLFGRLGHEEGPRSGDGAQEGPSQ